MIARIFFTGLFIYVPLYSQAQPGIYSPGAKAYSIGNASTANGDAWSLYNNISGISLMDSPEALFSYHYRFGTKALSATSAGFIYPLKSIALGLSIDRFGDQLFNQHQLGIGLSHKFGNTSIGAKFNYLHYAIKGYGTTGVINFEIGVLTKITSSIWIGAHIYNLNQAAIDREFEERVPSIAKAGLSYQPIKQVVLYMEVQKNINYNSQFKVGLEYSLSDKIFFRAGIHNRPFGNSFGLGYKRAKLSIDYAIDNHPVLGFSHLTGISYKLAKDNAKEK